MYEMYVMCWFSSGIVSRLQPQLKSSFDAWVEPPQSCSVTLHYPLALWGGRPHHFQLFFFLSPPVRWGLLVRFYVSCPASPFSFLLLRRTSTASARSQCSPPDPNNKHRIRALPAGPPPRAPDQCSPPDLNHKEFPKIYQIECQKKCQKICQIHMPERMSKRMSEHLPERMPEWIPEKMPNRMWE